MTESVNQNQLREELEGKIKRLNSTTWESRLTSSLIDEWVSQFDGGGDLASDEQLHALFLLSHFLYFGQLEIRSLLLSLFRDLIRAPMLQDIRRINNDTLDLSKIYSEYEHRQRSMRFLAVGNPSESGMHLLYYFRQENSLPKNLFINAHEIFLPVQRKRILELTIRNAEVKRYVFIDDLCGTGAQAAESLPEIVGPLKEMSNQVAVDYFVLFATSQGLRTIRNLDLFDSVGAVVEFDNSFRVLEDGSRIFRGEDSPIDRLSVRNTCQKYGKKLFPKYPLGYGDGQLLLGFNHNTPNNTLPIFWAEEDGENGSWTPVFKRYEKVLKK